MEKQHDDKSKPADHIKPKLICIGDNKRQQPENDRPGSGQQHPDYPKSKTCFWRNSSSANTAAPISTHKAGCSVRK